MKKYYLTLIFSLFFFTPLVVFAQNARIIDLTGNVMVKMNEAGSWNKAKINMVLQKNSELETKEDSNCTLAFDDAHKNVLTMKSNSRLKLDSIKPADVFLNEGRVFTLIESLSRNEKFQVRTPTAIAGARGTGWSTDFHNNKTNVLCFDDTVYVYGVDNEGNSTGEKDVPSGKGLEVGEGGTIGGLFNLDNVDFEEWDDFTGFLGDIGAGNNSGGDGNGGDGFEDSREEQREDYGDFRGLERRQEAESENRHENYGSGDEGPSSYDDRIERGE